MISACLTLTLGMRTESSNFMFTDDLPFLSMLFIVRAIKAGIDFLSGLVIKHLGLFEYVINLNGQFCDEGSYQK